MSPENPNEIVSGNEESHLCVSCKERPYETGFKVKLCSDCRQKFIKYPIPRWIWIFSGMILLVMLFGLFRMPDYVSSLMHLSRAEKAMAGRLYVTAQKELEQAQGMLSDNKEINGRLLIASARNLDIRTFSEAYNRILGVKYENISLLGEMEESTLFVQSIFPQDSTLAKNIEAIKDSSSLLLKLFNSYRDKADYLIAGVMVADRFYDQKNFLTAEVILDSVLRIEKEYYPAVSLMSSVKRNIQKFDEAILLCDRLLTLNKEDAKVIAHKARIELKRKNDAQAAIYAAEAWRIDSGNVAVMESQALVLYHGNRKKESLNMLAEIEKKEKLGGDTTVTQRLRPILTDRELYR